jgi:hypothetical protein
MHIRKAALAALVLVAISATAFAAGNGPSFGVQAERIIAMLNAKPELVAAARAAALEPANPKDKAVSKVDKNSFTIIGNVLAYDSDFLSDGTPITVGVASVSRPVGQDIYFSCIGGSIANSCRGLGRRQLDGWLLAGDGDETEEYLHFLVVTKLKK